MFVRQLQQTWIVFFLLLAGLSGCLSNDSSEGAIQLGVDITPNSDSIFEYYSDGERVSKSNVMVEFDFESTVSENDLRVFGIDTNDGRPAVTIDATVQTNISIEFYDHGTYNITAFAVDENNVNQSLVFSVPIELRIEWVQTDTTEPKTLAFDPRPVNEGIHPTMIEIRSVVENPTFIENQDASSQSVQITWNIVDELDDICQDLTAYIDDGDAKEWYTIHFNTYLLHELEVTYDEGQDNVDILHWITVVYDD
ncbi:MAG: hypothetical protein L7U62_03790 [Candidatus Poseidoniaceae archaeon]|nr:hypothetical protein [Candidatus Poseidoniaceae archaeon]